MEENIYPQTWYVYTYAYPDGTVFYVGKGTGGRMFHHEKEARSGCLCDKCAVIRDIWVNGGTVQKQIVFETTKENDALDKEKELITLYTLESLTNGHIGDYPRTHKYSHTNDDALLKHREMLRHFLRITKESFSPVVEYEGHKYKVWVDAHGSVSFSPVCESLRVENCKWTLRG